MDDRLSTDLLHATCILSVPGRESPAIAFVRSRLESLPNAEIRTDRFSQLHVRMRSEPPGHPTYWVAHLDHPGFIVEFAQSETAADLIFRGACEHLSDDATARPAIRIETSAGPVRARIDTILARGPSFTRVRATTQGPVSAGDLGTWEFPTPARIQDGTLHAPACDDLAGACVLLSAFEQLASRPPAHPIRLIFTRAEELGLLGTIAVCKDRLLPAQSSVVCVDAISSHDLHHAGEPSSPILIHADAMMTYSPRLLRHFASLGNIQPSSMRATGASEAGIFALSGFEALAIYFEVRALHNVDPAAPGRPSHESVRVEALRNLRDLLVRSAHHPPEGSSLRAAVDAAWKEWSPILLRPP